MPTFRHRSDDVIDIVLDEPWGAFTQALNDSLGTRPPRGDESPPPSTFWIDRVLAHVRGNDGTPVELSSGNATRIALDGPEVVASSDYDAFEDQRMPLRDFLELLRRWRVEVLDAQSRNPSARLETYDNTYPTCAQTHATLRVLSADLDPSAISHLLQVAPTASHRIGDPVTSDRCGHRKTNGWFLSSEGAVSSLDVRRHIDWLLDAVDELELLALTREHNARVDVLCYWESRSGHGGPQLSPPQMWRLSRLGLTVGFDAYFSNSKEEAVRRSTVHGAWPHGVQR